MVKIVKTNFLEFAALFGGRLVYGDISEPLFCDWFSVKIVKTTFPEFAALLPWWEAGGW